MSAVYKNPHKIEKLHVNFLVTRFIFFQNLNKHKDDEMYLTFINLI